jgi:antitoxin (DNA-binding transcriptional repressor) of toxin-antitoxin stability system
MEKTIGAFEIRRNLGMVLQNIAAHNDTYIVEKHGQPVAAVVPMEVLEQWKRSRNQFFEQLSAAQQNAALAPEEAEALADEAVNAIRKG